MIAEIKKAISNHLGRTNWESSDVRHRITKLTHALEDAVIITMDGKHIAKMGENGEWEVLNDQNLT